MVTTIILRAITALAGVAQWIERQTVKQRVTDSTPRQGTSLGSGQVPSSGHS